MNDSQSPCESDSANNINHQGLERTLMMSAVERIIVLLVALSALSIMP